MWWESNNMNNLNKWPGPKGKTFFFSNFLWTPSMEIDSKFGRFRAEGKYDPQKYIFTWTHIRFSIKFWSMGSTTKKPLFISCPLHPLVKSSSLSRIEDWLLIPSACSYTCCGPNHSLFSTPIFYYDLQLWVRLFS